MQPPILVTGAASKTGLAVAGARGLGGHAFDSLLRMFQYYDAHGFPGNPNVLRWLLGRSYTSLAEFARREFA